MDTKFSILVELSISCLKSAIYSWNFRNDLKYGTKLMNEVTL